MGESMKPSEVKKAVAFLCLIGLLTFLMFFLLDMGREMGEGGWRAFCWLPLAIFFAVVGLWAWSSSNADKVNELELEEIELKRRKRRTKEEK